MDLLTATTLFSALGQETRLSALRTLISAGSTGVSAGDLAGQLGVRQNTMSSNLTVLLHSGLVENRREGRTIRYFANFETLGVLLGFLMEDCCGGKPELCQPIIDELVCNKDANGGVQ